MCSPYRVVVAAVIVFLTIQVISALYPWAMALVTVAETVHRFSP